MANFFIFMHKFPSLAAYYIAILCAGAMGVARDRLIRSPLQLFAAGVYRQLAWTPTALMRTGEAGGGCFSHSLLPLRHQARQSGQGRRLISAPDSQFQLLQLGPELLGGE